MFGAQAPGLADTPLAARVDARHETWAAQLPEDAAELWDALSEFDSDSREALFAHCVALTLNATHDVYNRRPRALAHAGRLAEILALDLTVAGWVPNVENYLGRVTKARILEAVREAKGEQAAQRLEGLKKGDMAEAAAQALAGSGWLPEALRTKGVETMAMPIDPVTPATQSAAANVSANAAGEEAEAEDLPSAKDREQLEPHEIAAE